MPGSPVSTSRPPWWRPACSQPARRRRRRLAAPRSTARLGLAAGRPLALERRCTRVLGLPLPDAAADRHRSADTPWVDLQALLSLCELGGPQPGSIFRADPAKEATTVELKLPDGITTCLFDLDGVLTQTAKIHAQAWKQMFDDFLRDWAERHGEEFHEFDRPTDYDEYVDGKPRLDGVKSFLESRGINLPMGSPSDPPEAETIHALGTRKNNLVLELIRQQGVEPYEGSVRLAEIARDNGMRRAVVSSSTNCRDVLKAAGIDHLFEEVVDGVV